MIARRQPQSLFTVSAVPARVNIVRAVLKMIFPIAWLVLSVLVARAGFISLIPVADTSLLGYDPNANNGGASIIIAGNNFHGVTNRGLLRFDLSSIPAGSVLTRADLILEVTGFPTDGYVPALFEVHRVLRAWGEGVGDGGGSTSPPGQTNEATWNAAFAFATNWTTPGGDFSPTVSAEEPIGKVNQYQFTSSDHPQLLVDAQFWVDHSGQNFGWLLKDASEQSTGTARRFGSREDAGYEPRLEIDFVAPVCISIVSRTTNGIQFSFNAEPGFAYAVERTSTLPNTNTWTVITNFPGVVEPGDLNVIDPCAGTNSFYRVRRD